MPRNIDEIKKDLLSSDKEIHLEFNKDNPANKVWAVTKYILRPEGWVTPYGELLFSFDKETIFNLWTDYPQNFSVEQKAIFDKEYPYWASFFKDRTK